MLKEQELESKFSYLFCRTEADTHRSKACALQLCYGTQDNTRLTNQMQTILKSTEKKVQIAYAHSCTGKSYSTTATTISMDGPSHLEFQ